MTERPYPTNIQNCTLCVACGSRKRARWAAARSVCQEVRSLLRAAELHLFEHPQSTEKAQQKNTGSPNGELDALCMWTESLSWEAKTRVHCQDDTCLCFAWFTYNIITSYTSFTYISAYYVILMWNGPSKLNSFEAWASWAVVGDTWALLAWLSRQLFQASRVLCQKA